jgi:hypothetical protein
MTKAEDIPTEWLVAKRREFEEALQAWRDGRAEHWVGACLGPYAVWSGQIKAELERRGIATEPNPPPPPP